MKMGMMVTINQALDQDTAILVVEEMGHTATARKETAIEDKLAESVVEARGRRPAGAARARRHDHGPRRPRQDVVARLHSPHARRGRRGGRDHAAHRRVQRADAERQDHVPRHAGPRCIHRDARARRTRNGYRRARRRRRRRCDAADDRGDPAREGGGRADRRRDQQNRQVRRRSGPSPQRARNAGADTRRVRRRDDVRERFRADGRGRRQAARGAAAAGRGARAQGAGHGSRRGRRARVELGARPRRGRDGADQQGQASDRRHPARGPRVRPHSRDVRRVRSPDSRGRAVDAGRGAGPIRHAARRRRRPSRRRRSSGARRRAVPAGARARHEARAAAGDEARERVQPDGRRRQADDHAA